MNRLPQLDPSRTTGKTRELLDAVKTQLGNVPNLFRVLANSPAALEGFLSFNRALADGVLTSRVREQIALAVAEINYCGYSLSAHAYLGARVGLTEREVADARRVLAADVHTAAILSLARGIAVQRGVLGDAEVRAARAANISDAEIVETVANVGFNILTNYLNHVAQTVVDFPEVHPGVGEPDRRTHSASVDGSNK